ncbi:hypothetical protein [Lysobacter sp. HA18]
MESRLAIALVATLVAGCTTHGPPAQPLLPLEAPPPRGLQAIALTAGEYGVLVVNHGCVRVKSDQKIRTVLWSKNTRLDYDEHGYFLHREGSERRYRVGAPIEFGGGALGITPAGTNLQVIRRCGPPYHQGDLSG